ncbi:MAG: hypothetical protein L0Y71_06130 [Gemmataceae bacterium]|nr:hypothetical protein [Gemmataceae bacterium]
MASFPRAVGHFLFAGLLSGFLGAAVAALLFYLLVLGLLYAERPVQGAAQEAIEVPHVSDVVLSPPIAAQDLTPPPGKLPQFFDGDYLNECFGLLQSAVDQNNVLWTLGAWAAAAMAFAVAIGVLGAVMRGISARILGPLFGILALLATLAGIGALVAHFYYQVEIPFEFELNALGRLYLYAIVTGTSLLWISIVGFRLRALLFAVATVLTGEALVLGMPPDACTTTALWHVSLFVVVPAAYGWLAVERGELKQIIV